MKKFTFPILLILILVGISAYLYKGSGSFESDFLKTSRKSEVVAQDFFDNLSADDYQAAVVDFDAQMRDEMSPEQLGQLKGELSEKVGGLVNLGPAEIKTEKDNTIFEYHAEFEKEKDVLIRLVIGKENGENKITGFWLDSPKLRD